MCLFVARNLTNTDESLDRLDQFLRVVANAVFENDFDVFDVGNCRGGISFHHHQIGLFARRDRTDARVFAEKFRAIECCDLYCFGRVKPASTSSSTCLRSPKPATMPPLPVGSSPAMSNPPAFTNARSNSIALRSSARKFDSGETRARACR